MTALLEVAGPDEAVRRRHRRRRLHVLRAGRIDHGAGRPERLGQDDRLQPDHGYLRADAGSSASPGTACAGRTRSGSARRGLTRTFQQARVFPELTLVENLVAALQQPWRAVFRRAVRRDERARALELLEEFGLARLAGERAGELSYGQRKLLEFAAVLMGEPRLVLLDEPTAGVNPVLVEQMERRIRDLHARGLTFLSSSTT